MLPCRISPVTFGVCAREWFSISRQWRSTLWALHFRFPTHRLAPLFALKLPLGGNRLFLCRTWALLCFSTPGNELTTYGDSPSGEGGFVGLHYMLLPTLGVGHWPTRAAENCPTCEKRTTTDSTIHGRSPSSCLFYNYTLPQIRWLSWILSSLSHVF
jgi:hypothetical protein